MFSRLTSFGIVIASFLLGALACFCVCATSLSAFAGTTSNAKAAVAAGGISWESEESEGDRLLELAAKAETGAWSKRSASREAAMKHFIKAANIGVSEHSHLHWAISTSQMINVMSLRFEGTRNEESAYQINEIRRTADLLLPVLAAHPEIRDKRISEALKTAITMYGAATNPDYHKAKLLEDLLTGAQAPPAEIQNSHTSPWEILEKKGEVMLEEVQSSKKRWILMDSKGLEAAKKQLKEAAMLATKSHLHREWAISASQILITEVMALDNTDRDELKAKVIGIQNGADSLLDLLNAQPEIAEKRIAVGLSTVGRCFMKKHNFNTGEYEEDLECDFKRAIPIFEKEIQMWKKVLQGKYFTPHSPESQVLKDLDKDKGYLALAYVYNKEFDKAMTTLKVLNWKEDPGGPAGAAYVGALKGMGRSGEADVLQAEIRQEVQRTRIDEFPHSVNTPLTGRLLKPAKSLPLEKKLTKNQLP